MTYAIGDFIYGWDLSHHDGQPDPYAAFRKEINDLDDIGYVEVMYGHNHYPIIYLGVVTGSVEEHGVTPIKDVIEALTVKPENLQEFSDLCRDFEADISISQALKDAIAANPPSHFLAWTHS